MFKTVDDEYIWTLVKAERIRVLKYLRSLDDTQWNHQSLCDGWLVRDVVAHLAIEYKYTVSNSAIDFLRSGFNVNTFMMITAVEKGKKPRNLVLQMFEATVSERVLPKSLSPFNALVDLLVHEQDIRIALGDQRHMPTKPLRLIFSNWIPADYNFGEKITGVADRVKGLKFVANDLDLTVGSGDEVIGSAHDILLAITGRRAALSTLTGEGSKLLIKRIL